MKCTTSSRLNYCSHAIMFQKNFQESMGIVTSSLESMLTIANLLVGLLGISPLGKTTQNTCRLECVTYTFNYLACYDRRHTCAHSV